MNTLNTLDEIMDRLSDINALSQKLDNVLNHLERLGEITVEHEHRLTEIETQQRLKQQQT